MMRKVPKVYLANEPCLVTALCCATGSLDRLHGYPVLRKDGYATLASANKWIRANLKIRKRTDYKRGQRPKLKDLHLDGQAVVCVFGHYVFLDKETYWSFFENEEDEVVAVWEMNNSSL